MGKEMGGKGSMKNSPEGQMHQETAGELLGGERETAQLPPATEHPSGRTEATPAQPCATVSICNRYHKEKPSLPSLYVLPVAF